jgi:hypothetical protein
MLLIHNSNNSLIHTIPDETVHISFITGFAKCEHQSFSQFGRMAQAVPVE